MYEKNLDGSLKELHRASGGPWGGTCVDKNYIDWLTQMFGEQAMERMKQNLEDYVYMLREFENKKSSLTPETKGRITLSAFWPLMEYHKESDEENIASKIARMNLKEEVKCVRNILRVSVDIARKWFQHPIDMTIRHINGILTEPGMKDVNNIFLVGGFAECELVQAAVKNAFEGRIVIIPEEATLAMLKGAVMFGHQPRLGLISTPNVCNAPPDQVGGNSNVCNAPPDQVGGNSNVYNAPSDQVGGKINVYNAPPDQVGGKINVNNAPSDQVEGKINVNNAPSDQVGGKMNVYDASSDQVGGKIKGRAQP